MKISPANDKTKHVIILGAGASITSGYPDAKELRLLLLSKEKVHDRVRKQGGLSDKEIEQGIFPMFAGPAEALTNLFRQGGFATVDEFSSLASTQHSKEVQDLKRRVRFALGLHNPEVHFEKSDYYPFIQKLFSKGIFPLRNDISVLTFNYDSYLPFLLQRAVEVRYKAAGKRDVGSAEFCLTSGFKSRALGALQDADGLCLLQMHGMIAWPKRFEDERVVDFDDLFSRRANERLEKLHSNTLPPIVFPWEIIGEDGQFRPKVEFCLQENCGDDERRQGGYRGPNDLYAVFTSIWKRARKEINAATKISFVGLSMHEFLNPAFRFLFWEKKNAARIVVANKELEKFRSVDQAFENPRSPACSVRRLLKTVWAKKEGGLCSDGMVNVERRETFEEFIQYEMD